MARIRISLGDIYSAALAPLGLGTLVGVAICGALFGLGWWADVPSQRQGAWAYAPSPIAGGSVSIYMFWIFASGKFLPAKIWQRIAGFFEGVRDASP